MRVGAGARVRSFGLWRARAAAPGGCAHSEAWPPREPARETAAGTAGAGAAAEVQVGYATWYGAALAGHRTASGERFDPSKMTAAHRALPFGTWVQVTRVDTGRSVRVRITDCGPFGHEERIIDLSRAAAKELGTLKTGVVRVELRHRARPVGVTPARVIRRTRGSVAKFARVLDVPRGGLAHDGEVPIARRCGRPSRVVPSRSFGAG